MNTSGPNKDELLPGYLRTHDLLAQHFRAHLEGLNTTEKGQLFAQFVQRIIPQSSIGEQFEPPRLSERKSRDEGVDLKANGRERNRDITLYAQAKLWIDRTEAIDGIISKFQDFQTAHHAEAAKTLSLFDNESDSTQFLIVSLSPLESLIERYESKNFASKAFYMDLKAAGRIHFLDGHKMLPILQAAYRKTSELPADLTITLNSDIIRSGNVYLGIISSHELQRLYRQFGDALFFENVRDFLGVAKERSGRTTPNGDIVRTIENSPHQMLEKNNGIVVRASNVTEGNSPRQLHLKEGSIVNGCQTTMCLVTYSQETCYVPVKIVQTEDAWDIARAANYQNAVDEINLELAKHIRPQLVKRAANLSGVQLEMGEESVFQIIDTIYNVKVDYEEVRLFYVGLFSSRINNVFAANYAELRYDLLNRFHQEDPSSKQTFDLLFDLQRAAKEGFDRAQSTFTHESYSELFKRFYRPGSPSYHCFVSLLALCGLVNIDISSRNADPQGEYERMVDFLEKSKGALDESKDKFLIYYVHAVKLWMQSVKSAEADETAILRDMRTKSERLKFTNLYQNLCMEADSDPRLKGPKH